MGKEYRQRGAEWSPKAQQNLAAEQLRRSQLRTLEKTGGRKPRKRPRRSQKEGVLRRRER